MTQEPVHADHMSGREIRERAVSGAAIDAIRGVGIRALGVVGTAVLARLLTPHDFGVIAFGATLITFAGFLSDGGVGTALIRRVDPPSRADLKALVAFQLIVNLALAGGIGLVMAPFGKVGEVTMLMVVSLPLGAFRVPGSILLERRLEYRPLALVDIIETVAYYSWAITTVSLGWGVWGLASGNVVRTLIGTSSLLFLLPAGRMIPSPSWARVRPLLGFGFRYQAVGFVQVLRDQGINLSVALIGGVSALGLWSVAYRILQIPLLLFTTLWRVSFPAMSRLVAAREDLRETIERVLGVVAVGAGLILAPLVAASPDLVPVLLGHRWSAAAPVIPPASLYLMIACPVSVALVGYLWAVGDAAVILRASLLGIPILAVVMLPLLPLIGVAAVGFGWIAMGIIETIVFIRGARRHLKIAIAARLGPPTLFAVIAALAGWFAAWSIGPSLPGAAAGAALATALYLITLFMWHRSYLLDAIALTSQGLRGALRPSATSSGSVVI